MSSKINLLFWFFLCHTCNIADAILTLNAISHGAEELNPLMAWLISISPALFVTVKLVLFGLGIDILSRRRPEMLAWVGYLYIAVVMWHLNFIFYL